MSQKLALHIEAIGKAHLIDSCVVSHGIAKSSNISASNCVGSNEVFAVKEMNDIGIDALASDVSIISTKTSK
jgi:hypothetical protein